MPRHGTPETRMCRSVSSTATDVRAYLRSLSLPNQIPRLHSSAPDRKSSLADHATKCRLKDRSISISTIRRLQVTARMEKFMSSGEVSPDRGTPADGPRATEFLEVLRLRGMPIAREDHGQAPAPEQADRAVHPRDDRVAIRHPERSTWTEVILDVDDEQCGPLPHGPNRPNPTVSKSLRPLGSS